MKRREFLTLMSTVGIGATLSDGLTTGSGPLLSSRQLRSGSIWFSHRRQGFGYPVFISLELPHAGDLDAPPPLYLAREGEERWCDRLDPSLAKRNGSANEWTWEWVPPPVRPTELEERAEVLRFRAALVDASGRQRGLCSDALEVVCARRGWGC